MQERFLEGRTALVTGSVQGIGLAIGKALASAGARLAVHGLATLEQADATVHTMREAGAPDARFFDADMRKPAAIKVMMDSVTAWGGPDILVNNAGIQQTASIAEVTQGGEPVGGVPHNAACAAGNGNTRIWTGGQHRFGARPGSLGE